MDSHLLLLQHVKKKLQSGGSPCCCRSGVSLRGNSCAIDGGCWKNGSSVQSAAGTLACRPVSMLDQATELNRSTT